MVINVYAAYPVIHLTIRRLRYKTQPCKQYPGDYLLAAPGRNWMGGGVGLLPWAITMSMNLLGV